jgi:hypothetical protein
MVIRIYVRERIKIGSGVKHPRYRVVAVTSDSEDDTSLDIEAIHFRKVEIEQIAKDLGAEIIYLQAIPEEKRGRMKDQ